MRKLACFAAPFGVAVLLCCYALTAQWALWLGVLCALMALPLALLRGDVRTRSLLLAIGAAAGFLWFWGWTELFRAPADALADTTQTVSATALDYPEVYDWGVSLEVRLENGAAVRLYAGEECAEVRPGDGLTFTARFQSSDTYRGEKSTWNSARGVFLTAYAGEDGVSVSPRERTPFYLLPTVWARALNESLDRVFPEGTAPFLRAVVLGDKSGLDGSVITAFNRTGLAHLLVVSGLHVSMLLWGLRRVLRGRRKLLAALGLPLLVIFVLMVGCKPSAIRAAVMSSLLIIAPLLRRENDAPTSLSVALLALLIQNPYAAASVSLQLSFASVAGILLVSERLDEWLREWLLPAAKGRLGRVRNRVLVWVYGSVSVTLGAMLFTTPLIALWFGMVSLVSPLSNLLCLWAGQYCFLGGALCALLGLLSPAIAAPFAWVTDLLSRFVLAVAEGLSALPFAAVTLDTVYYGLWLTACYAVVACFFLFRREFVKRIILPICSLTLLFCAAVCFTVQTYTSAPLTVTALDVGQGAATAFLSRWNTMLVDCGGNEGDSAGDTAADYFQSLGISRLDLLVFTHLDDDHCNGMAELFARMEVAAVALPDCGDANGRRTELETLASAEGAEVIYVTEELEAQLGGCTVILYPPLGSGTTNEEGLFVRCSLDSYDVLITGDADSFVEGMLVKYCDVPDIELLLVGHHGAAGSTSAEFLAAVKPERAIISSGYNTYGHPSAAVLERLNAAGVSIYRTDLHGDVTVTVRGDGDTIS